MADKEVCILTSVHPPFDIRIFQKEAKSLNKHGYKVLLIAQHHKEDIKTQRLKITRKSITFDIHLY